MDRFRWTVIVGAILLAVASGVVAYNVGVTHGLAIAAAESTSSATPLGAYPYFWYRPWGFGLFGPFFFVLFWFLLFRLIFWGGFRGRRWYYRGRSDFPAGFEEWHRRAHERMTNQSTI